MTCYLCSEKYPKYNKLTGDDMKKSLDICNRCTVFIIDLMRIPTIKCDICEQLFHTDDIEILHQNRKICMYCVKNKEIQTDECYCCKTKYAYFDFALINEYTNAKYCLQCMQLFSLINYDDLVDMAIDNN